MHESWKKRGEGHTSTRLGLVLGVLILGACSPVASPKVTEPRSVTHVPFALSATAEPGAVSPPGNMISHVSSSSDAPEVRAEHEPSPFHRVLEGAGGFVEADGRHYWSGRDGLLVSLTDGSIVANCEHTRGYLLEGKSLWRATRFSPFSACPDNPMLSRFRGGIFELYRSMDVHQLLTSPWLKTSTLAAIVPHRSGPPWGYELLSLEGGVTPPRPQRGARGLISGSESDCYSQLQDPVVLFAFSTGEIFVLGERQCGLLPEQDTEQTEQEWEQSEEKQRELSRPVAEFWKQGAWRSKLLSLPLQEIRLAVAFSPESIWILGTPVEGAAPLPPGTNSSHDSGLVLLHFDGSQLSHVGGVDLRGVEVLITRGKEGRLDGLWTFSERTLRPLGLARGTPVDGAIQLPDSCATPWGAIFEEQHVWLRCEEGLYSTDPARPEIVVPEEQTTNCTSFDPEPEFAVRGLYKNPSNPGCGSQSRTAPPSFQSGKPSPSKAPSRKLHNSRPLVDFSGY